MSVSSALRESTRPSRTVTPNHVDSTFCRRGKQKPVQWPIGGPVGGHFCQGRAVSSQPFDPSANHFSRRRNLNCRFTKAGKVGQLDYGSPRKWAAGKSRFLFPPFWPRAAVVILTRAVHCSSSHHRSVAIHFQHSSDPLERIGPGTSVLNLEESIAFDVHLRGH